MLHPHPELSAPGPLAEGALRVLVIAANDARVDAQEEVRPVSRQQLGRASFSDEQGRRVACVGPAQAGLTALELNRILLEARDGRRRQQGPAASRPGARSWSARTGPGSSSSR